LLRELEEVVKNITERSGITCHPISPSVYILHNYSTMSKPGNEHWKNGTKPLDHISVAPQCQKSTVLYTHTHTPFLLSLSYFSLLSLYRLVLNILHVCRIASNIIKHQAQFWNFWELKFIVLPEVSKFSIFFYFLQLFSLNVPRVFLFIMLIFFQKFLLTVMLEQMCHWQISYFSFSLQFLDLLFIFFFGGAGGRN
jgi:hypothetical protein